MRLSNRIIPPSEALSGARPPSWPWRRRSWRRENLNYDPASLQSRFRQNYVVMSVYNVDNKLSQSMYVLSRAWPSLGGISNTVGGVWKYCPLLADPPGTKPRKNYTSQRTVRQKSQPYDSQETAHTVFEIPLNRGPSAGAKVTHLWKWHVFRLLDPRFGTGFMGT